MGCRTSEKRTVPIPLPDTDQWASLTATWPLTEAQWNYMMSLLAVMKPGLVEAAGQPAHGGDGG